MYKKISKHQRRNGIKQNTLIRINRSVSILFINRGGKNEYIHSTDKIDSFRRKNLTLNG